MRLAIIIPAYNEEKTLKQVIKTIPRKFPKVTCKEIIVINDGSTDNTEKIARRSEVTVISHLINRGLGAALGTGFEYARQDNFDLLVTFDADGQHNPNDIYPVIKPILEQKADIVIGSRLKNYKNHTCSTQPFWTWWKIDMPWYRVVGIWGLNIITFVFFWTWTSDSQSGLRAFNKKSIQKIKIKANKMEVSSEFFDEAQRHNLKVVEVPIKSIYTTYSLAKGQKNINVFKILSKMIYRRFFTR